MQYLDAVAERTAHLPIWSFREEILASLRSCQNLVLSCAPGSGKSTILPLLLSSAPDISGGKVALLEPRRIAAWSVASRMAELLGEELGGKVGLRMRFENRVSKATCIEVLTEGTLIRLLQADPGMEAYGTIILDEFHERSLAADLSLALLKEVQAVLRPDLRIIVTSATIDLHRLVEFLQPAAAVIGTNDRLHPVAIRYGEDKWQDSPSEIALRGIRQAISETSGDVLAFLPGQREIRACYDSLTAVADAHNIMLPFHGGLSLAEQRRAMSPVAGKRRVILATSLAETSLTIEGIEVVVDSGFARIAKYDPPSGFSEYVTTRITRDAAEQRAGRAGRLGPGVCYRLWSARTHESLAATRVPEIAYGDLSNLVLETLLWGAASVEALPWLDTPHPARVASSMELLRALDAIDRNGKLTPIGKEIAAIPAHPRLGAMVLYAKKRNLLSPACAVATILETSQGRTGNDVDMVGEVEALLGQAKWLDKKPDSGEGGRLATFRSWCRRVQVDAHEKLVPKAGAIVGELVAAAFPERLARKRPGGDSRYVLRNGKGARLREGSSLKGSEWLAVADVHLTKEDSVIVRAAAYDGRLIQEQFKEGMVEEKAVRCEVATGRVFSRCQTRLGAILLADTPIAASWGEAEINATLAALRELAAAAEGGASEGIVPKWLHPEVFNEVSARISFAREWLPEESFPQSGVIDLLKAAEEWLSPLLEQCGDLHSLTEEAVLGGLYSTLSASQRGILREHVPQCVRLGGIPRVYPISYEVVSRPCFSVRLQDLFGVNSLPRLARGRVPLSVALLSPAGRPLQITSDLGRFWESSYQQVRSEMRGRYPKHAWPEQPHTLSRCVEVSFCETREASARSRH